MGQTQDQSRLNGQKQEASPLDPKGLGKHPSGMEGNPVGDKHEYQELTGEKKPEKGLLEHLKLQF
jgi:hypothetical protein